MSKIIGNTVGMGLPKPNLMQTDPTKGDYVKGKEEFAKQFSSQNPSGSKVYVTLDDDGTIVIAPDKGDSLEGGITITVTQADDGTILIGGGQNA